MGDELRLQSWIFDMFILDRIDRELHSLERLELKFDSSFILHGIFIHDIFKTSSPS